MVWLEGLGRVGAGNGGLNGSCSKLCSSMEDALSIHLKGCGKGVGPLHPTAALYSPLSPVPPHAPTPSSTPTPSLTARPTPSPTPTHPSNLLANAAQFMTFFISAKVIEVEERQNAPTSSQILWSGLSRSVGTDDEEWGEGVPTPPWARGESALLVLDREGAEAGGTVADEEDWRR